MDSKNPKITNEQALKLLQQIQQLDEGIIEPLSDEEVEAIESEFQPISVSKEMDERQLEHLEMLRQEWLKSKSGVE